MNVIPGHVVMCRACVVECTKYKSLHNYKFMFNRKLNTTYAGLLEYIADIGFPENESSCLPEYICDNCIQQLVKAYVFKKRVLGSDKLLRYELEDDGGIKVNDSLEETKVENAKLLKEQYSQMNSTDSMGSDDIDSQQLSDEDTKIGIDLEPTQITDSKDPEKIQIDESEENESEMESETNSYDEEEDSTSSDYRREILEDRMLFEAEREIRLRNTQQDIENPLEFKSHAKKPKTYISEHKSHSKKAKTYISEIKSRSQCKICGKHFSYKSSYKYHMQYHGEGKIQCEICGKTLKTTNEYLGHISTHLPNKCDICGKSYKHPSSLRSHIKLHTGEVQMINCRLCDKSFTRKWNYQQHMLTHQKHMENADDYQIPFKCEYCDKAYTIEENLNSHRRRHCNMFKCVECSEIFTSKELLKDHMIWHPSSDLNITNTPIF